MAGRHQKSSSAVAAEHDCYCTDNQDSAAQQNTPLTNGHIDFSFRKRVEKIDWRKIGLFDRRVFWISNLHNLDKFVNKMSA